MIPEFDVIPTIIGILILVIPSMLLGKLCKHFRISEVIGFVIGGVIFGPFSIGGLIIPDGSTLVNLNDFTLGLWQVSGVIILFSAGLHFTFKDLRKAGYRAIVVGTLGVVLPLITGYGIAIIFGLDWTVSILVGTTLSATSIAVTVTLLEELRKEKTVEGNILVNSAVLDDVLGLAVLSAVVSVVMTHTLPTIPEITLTTIEVMGFWFAILLGAVFVLPKIVHGVALAKPSSLETRGTKQATALGSAFGFAAIASLVGLNPVVGAFSAGMGLAGSKLARQVREFVGELKIIVAPLFFAIIGAHVDLRQISEVNYVFLIALLTVAIGSKIVGCGIPSTIMLQNRTKGLRIGYGMIARGEIAFITAGIGLSSGIILDSIYTTLVLVILITIIIAPILLRFSYRKEDVKV